MRASSACVSRSSSLASESSDGLAERWLRARCEPLRPERFALDRLPFLRTTLMASTVLLSLLDLCDESSDELLDEELDSDDKPSESFSEEEDDESSEDESSEDESSDVLSSELGPSSAFLLIALACS